MGRRIGLDAGELRAALGDAVRIRSLKAGEMLFRQGDAAAAIYCVETGRLRLVRHTACGTAVTVHTARAGESFAEPSLFSDAYHCNCVADVASRVAVFPKDALLRVMEQDVRLALRMMARLSRLVQSLRTKVEHRNIRSAKERVLRALMLQAPAGGGWFEIDGTLKDMASEVGLTHEALYRALHDLEEDRRIARSGRSIALLEPDQIDGASGQASA